MTTTFPTDPGSAPRRNLVCSLASACVVGVLLIGMCVSCSDQYTATTTSSSVTAATVIATTTPATTSRATIAPTTTSETTSRTSVAPDTSVIAAPPGRLPVVDATAKITALFPTPFAAGDAQTLATETTNRLRGSFEAAGFSADLRGVSLVAVERSGRPTGSVMAYVVEVRNQEASGDDSTPGYDLIVTMERDDSGNWTITKAEQQQICQRGTSTIDDRPVCV